MFSFLSSTHCPYPLFKTKKKHELNLGKECQSWGTRTRSLPVAPSALPCGNAALPCSSRSSGLKSCRSPGDGPALAGSGQSPVTDVPGCSETHTAPRVTSPLFLLPPETSSLSTATLGCSSPRIQQEQTHREDDTGHISSPTQDAYEGKSNFCTSNARNFL